MRYWIPYLAASIGLHLAAVVTAAAGAKYDDDVAQQHGVPTVAPDPEAH
jgi:hypothetical protein